MEYFQISCNFNKLANKQSQVIINYLKEHYSFKINHCCLLEPEFKDDDTIYYICQSCREKLFLKSNANLNSLWIKIAEDKSFPFPDHSGETYILQDCWRDREHPEIHEAVRKILHKMNITIIELENNQRNANFCGNFHFECINEDLIKEMELYNDPTMHSYPDDLKIRLMEDYSRRFNGYPVITYCNRCTNFIKLAYNDVSHLLSFLFV